MVVRFVGMPRQVELGMGVIMLWPVVGMGMRRGLAGRVGLLRAMRMRVRVLVGVRVPVLVRVGMAVHQVPVPVEVLVLMRMGVSV